MQMKWSSHNSKSNGSGEKFELPRIPVIRALRGEKESCKRNAFFGLSVDAAETPSSPNISHLEKKNLKLSLQLNVAIERPEAGD